MKEIYFAGGCFWGTEHYFKLVNGVVATEVGYANGHTENPTYQDVCTDKTGFAETVHIVYDPEAEEVKGKSEDYIQTMADADIEMISREMPSFKRIKQVYLRTEPFEKTTTQKIKRRKIRTGK